MTDYTPGLQTLVKQALESDAEMQALGLPATRSVFQADTLESPTTKPFVICRWGESGQRMGAAMLLPLLLWYYDEEGDYTRVKLLRKRGTQVLLGLQETLLSDFSDITVPTGVFTQFTEGNDGADLADPGWQAVVVPKTLTAVGSGF